MNKYFILLSLLIILSCTDTSNIYSNKKIVISNIKNDTILEINANRMEDTTKYYTSCQILQFVNNNPFVSDCSKVITQIIKGDGMYKVKRDILENEDIEVRYASNPFTREYSKIICKDKVYDIDSIILGYSQNYKDNEQYTSYARIKFSIIKINNRKFYFLLFRYAVTNMMVGDYTSCLIILDENKNIHFKKEVKMCEGDEFLSKKEDILYIHYLSPCGYQPQTGDSLIRYNLISNKIEKYWILDSKPPDLNISKFNLYKFRK